MREGNGRPGQFPSAESSVSQVSEFAPDQRVVNRGLVECVNHQLRTPVAAILLHSELLIDHGHALPEDVRRSFASIRRSGHRLKDLVVAIGDLVDVACVGMNFKDTIDVSDLLGAAVASQVNRAEARGVRLVIAGDRGASCVGDASRLRRALRELLDNAVTYAPDRSTVCVAATVAGARIRIAVRDHGPGIDWADRERLVRPFERGTHPRQEAAGLGLGLALASAIAAGHGGQLVLADTPGGGLEARLELPRDGMGPTGSTPAP